MGSEITAGDTAAEAAVEAASIFESGYPHESFS